MFIFREEDKSKLLRELEARCSSIIDDIEDFVKYAGNKESLTKRMYNDFKYIVFGVGSPSEALSSTIDIDLLSDYIRWSNGAKKRSIERVKEACKKSRGMKFVDFVDDRDFDRIMLEWYAIIDQAAGGEKKEEEPSYVNDLRELAEKMYQISMGTVLKWKDDPRIESLNHALQPMSSILSRISDLVDRGYLFEVIAEEIMKHLKKAGHEVHDIEELL